jgi:hypothetical protein
MATKRGRNMSGFFDVYIEFMYRICTLRFYSHIEASGHGHEI